MTTSARAATGPTTGFLEESPGNRSSMRLMCLLALLASIAFAAVTMVRSAPILTRDSAGQETLTAPPRDDTGMLISFAFLLAAFAPKVVQKSPSSASVTSMAPACGSCWSAPSPVSRPPPLPPP
jgi:hypothetical protein